MVLITLKEAVVLQFHPQINNKVSSIGIFHQNFNQLKWVRKITLSKNKLSTTGDSINNQFTMKSQALNIKETARQLLVVPLSIQINNMKLKMKDFPFDQITKQDNLQTLDLTLALTFLHKFINRAQNRTQWKFPILTKININLTN